MKSTGRLLKCLLYTALFAILMVSCTKDKGPFIIDDEPIDNPDTIIPLSYSAVIQPIFDEKCTGCHHESHPMLDLQVCCSFDQIWFSGVNAPYVDTLRPDSSVIYRHLTGELELMPPWGDPVTDTEREKIHLWISQGARNN